jgi:hypothetical protein
MAIEKITPRKLNKDADARLLKATEAEDMLNVRISHNDDGNAGVIKNAFGNRPVQQVLEEGDNICVGKCVVEQRNDIYFFVWNSENNHGIYKYSFAQDEARKIIIDSVFNFFATDYIQSDALIDINGDTLITFTTGRGEPFLINASKAERNGYNIDINDSDSVREEYFTLAKKPPTVAPSFVFSTDTSRQQNLLIDKVFQFAAQYVYDDGHVSALSSYSKAAFSSNSVLYDRIPDPTNATFNKITVSVPHSEADVKKIRFFARIGNNGTFFEIGEVDNNKFATTPATIDFYNDKVLKYLSADEENKLFDAVPTDLRSLRISNNRLFCGDYKEGFDNVPVDVDLYEQRKEASSSYNFPAYNLNKLTSQLSSNVPVIGIYRQNGIPSIPTYLDPIRNLGFQVDVSNIPSVLKAGMTVYVDITVAYENIQYVSPNASPVLQISLNNENWRSTGVVYLHGDPIRIRKNINIESDTTKADFKTILRNELKSVVPGVKINQDSTQLGLLTQIERTTGAAQTSKIAFSGEIAFSILDGYDTMTDVNQNLLNFDLKISGGSIRVIKRVQNSNSQVTTVFSSGGVLGSTWLSRIDGGQSVYWFFGYTVSLSLNNILSLSDIRHFKTNAAHNFGIHYKDKRTRRSFVMPINSLYVGNSPFPNGGAVGVVAAINNTPPDWASSYSVVYAGNDKYDYYEQYSVAEAFAGNNDSFEFDTIYASMRHLEGKPNSFIDSKSPDIDYKFVKGDRLRIIGNKQNDGSGNYNFVTKDSVEYEIIDYRFFDETDTPISTTGADPKYRSTGWFLVLRDKGYSGFSVLDILNSEDLWHNDVIVEVYRPKKNTTEIVYREIGEEYPIIEFNNFRWHGGSHRDASYAGITTSVIITGSATDGWSFQTSEEVFVGEVLTFTIGLTEYVVTITNVTPTNDGTFNIRFTPEISADSITTAQSIANVPITNFRTIVKIDDGDCYLRQRAVKLNATYDKSNADFVKSTKYEYLTIECDSVNDFFESNHYSYGKPNTVDKNAKRTHRKSSITYSDAFVLDSNRQNISSFNNSLANWVDYSNKYGGIRYIVDAGDGLTVLQERKVFRTPVGRNLIEYADGQANATVSTDVISDKPQYYAGDFGCNDNPESVDIDVYGRIYFVDARQRKPVRISSDGAQAIDTDMGSFFSKLLTAFNSRPFRYKIFGTVDRENEEYIVSFQDIYTGVFNVYETPIEDLEPEPNFSYSVPIDENGIITVGYEINDDITPGWEDEDRNWEELCENWEDAWLGVMFIDIIDSQPTVYLTSDAIAKKGNLVPVIITTTTRDFYVYALYQVSQKLLQPEQEASCEYWLGVVDLGTLTVKSGETLGYNMDKRYWTTRYSFKPEMMAAANDKLFTWQFGQMYIHDEDALRCNYFGEQYDWGINVISNYDPSKSKFYRALSIEGDANAVVTVTNEDQQTSVSKAMWRRKERLWYSDLPRTSTENSWSNYVFIGRFKELKTLWVLEFGLWNDSLNWIDTKVWVDTPQAGTGTSALVFYNQINRIPIPKGCELFRVPKATFEASQATPDTSVSFVPAATNMTASNVLTKNSLGYTGTNVFQDGDMMYIKKNSVIDGDVIRGTWMKMNFVFSDSIPKEVYALNAIYQTSMLHNELGEQDRLGEVDE